MLYTYPICLIKGDGYTVVFPDFHTFIHVQGDREESLSYARSALYSYIKMNLDNKAPIPPATKVEQLNMNELGEIYGFPPEDGSLEVIAVGIKELSYQYPACFYRCENGYRAIFPDLGDLSVTSGTRKDVSAAASDCLCNYLKSQMRRGISIPKPTRKESVSAKRVGDALNLDFENAFVDMVTVTV